MQSAASSQRGTTSSQFYLERVGFESYVRLRLDLKDGSNSIGRIKSEKIDFVVHSPHCSALHCILTVSGDSVEIVNKSTKTGTTINGIKMNEEIVKLKEHDVIGIVRPTSKLCNLTGNYGVFIYRLRKYSSENPLIIEIDDDVTYEVSDDDEANGDDGIIILDPVDEQADHDRLIQLSRELNAEIKQEDIDDIEEFEIPCEEIKQVPSNFFEIESTETAEQPTTEAVVDPHLDFVNTKNETVNKVQRKANEKNVSGASETQQKSNDTRTKATTTAKVKYTKDNRGAFLTDPTQMPGPPLAVKERRKSKVIVPSPKLPRLPSTSSADNGNGTTDTEMDDILNKLIDQNDYSNYKAKKLSFSDLRQPETIKTGGASDNNLTVENEHDFNETSGTSTIFSESPSPTKILKLSVSDAVSQLAQIDNVLCSTSNGATEQSELKHKNAVKQSRFQINPCHEIISILTSYDSEQFKSVDLFCKSVDTNINSFKDTFKDYSEYQGTILPLILLELYKEIELEYTNSKIHNFLTVAVTDRNLEKRGDRSRMVFHCQIESLSKSQSLYDGHIVFVRCEYNDKKLEFLAVITNIAYIKKSADRRFVHFTMETSVITETLPVNTLEVRAITVISNTLNAFRSVYSLANSPLLNLILNPLSGQPLQCNAGDVVYKGYDKLDANQTSIVNAIYKQCINLNVPNISLLDGAAGTGKSCIISNLALQLVYGKGLPRPLRILIGSRTNRNIDEITKKLIHMRNKSSTTQKVQLVRYGLPDHIDKACRCVSVQYMREHEQRFLQLANINKLEKEKKTLELKIRALRLDDENDHTAELILWQSKHIKITTLIGRLAAIDESKATDPTNVLLNACDIICTTLGSIPKLQNYIPSVDVCIIDEATQCNESLTLLPFGFGMSSLVLVGDSCLPPPMVYSSVANEKNYGKSLFSRFQKLFSGKSGSPIYRINVQHRMHPEILKWPNRHFYENQLHAVASKAENFPIVPYKIISYGPVPIETDNLMLIVNVLLCHIDWKLYSIGIICTDWKLKLIVQKKLVEHPFIAVNSGDEQHLSEKDLIIIWISKEHGMRHLCDYSVFNRVVTRARQCLLICGADLSTYKSRPIWKSIQEDAHERKCFHHIKNLSQPKLVNVLRKK